ncbi:MAG: nucleoside monophosphate kinase [Firmicutes bacterium]|nr:nucleoside monophosphate kinase [Bacillota bacterium]
MNKLLVLLIGKPHCGKSTLAGGLVSHYSKKHKVNILSAKTMLDSMDKESALRKEIEMFRTSGQLIPDDIVEEMLENASKKISGDIVLLDGVLRSVKTAKLFDGRGPNPLGAQVHLDISDNLSIERSIARGRIDDAFMLKRLVEYEEYTLPAIRYIRLDKNIKTHDISVTHTSTEEETLFKTTNFLSTEFGI